MVKSSLSEAELDFYSNTENWFTYPAFLDLAAETPGFKVYVEVGSWKGHSTSYLAKQLVMAGKEFNLFAVDLWDNLKPDNELWTAHPEQMPYIYDIYNFNLEREGVRDFVRDLKMDSAEASKEFRDNSVDFCFVDAGHTYESAKADIEAWWPKIRGGCVLAGHDIRDSQVRRAVLEKFKDRMIYTHFRQNVWCVVKD